MKSQVQLRNECGDTVGAVAKATEASAEEKVFLQIKAELSDGDTWRRFVIPMSMPFFRLHYSLAVAFDRIDDIAEDFTFHTAGGKELGHLGDFQEKVADKVVPGDVFGYAGCNGIDAKVTVEGLCRLDSSLPPFYPILIGASEDADIFQINCFFASVALDENGVSVSDVPDELRAAFINLSATFAAKRVDPSKVMLLD